MSSSHSQTHELCEFEGDRPLLHHFNLEEGIRTAETPTVVRHCQISLRGCAMRSLAELIKTAERHFRTLWNETGIATVPHTWGLYPLEAALAGNSHLVGHLNPTDEDVRARYGYSLLPPGTLLAAEVAVIEAHEAPALGQADLRLAIDSYAHASPDVRLSDISPMQCIFGVPKASAPVEGSSFYLVDIEPRFAHKPT